MQDIKYNSGIYCIENISTKKKYIGQSINIENRWSKHKSELKHSVHDNNYLQKAWNKYGESDFKFYVLEYCEKEKLNDLEKYYIDYYNTMDRKLGYNLKSGGQDTNYQSKEVREKISKSNKKSYQNSDLKEIRRIDALNQWSNPEIKQKIMGKNNGMYGKTHSEEARKKISEAQKGHISVHRNLTPVLCIETGKIYTCAAEAQKELNTTTSVLEVCKGNRKTAGGYHWQFYIGNNI